MNRNDSRTAKAAPAGERVVTTARVKRALNALRARPEGGDFDEAIARLVEAEGTLGGADPAQGRLGTLPADVQARTAHPVEDRSGPHQS